MLPNFWTRPKKIIAGIGVVAFIVLLVTFMTFFISRMEKYRLQHPELNYRFLHVDPKVIVALDSMQKVSNDTVTYLPVKPEIKSPEAMATGRDSVSMICSNCTLPEVLRLLRENYGTRYLTDPGLLIHAHSVTISLQHVSIVKAVSVICEGQPFACIYDSTENEIWIKEKTK